MKQQIIMHKKTASGYDEIYPDTSADNILTTQTVANNAGVDNIDAQTVLESISATDKMISGYGTTSGTASAYTVNLVGKENMTPVDGMMIKVKFHENSNEEPTIDVNGLGAKSIFTENGLKVLGMIKAGAWCILMYSLALDGWVIAGWCKRKKLYTEIITSSQSWTPPEDVKQVTLRLFGGGGSGGGRYGSTYSGGGGGGGHMTLQTVSVLHTPYQITIGAGGLGDFGLGNAGGTTSFGTLAVALGGEGGGSYEEASGGNGGSGGGGVGSGGDATYGGGGGSGSTGNGGNGGTYGGGGGTSNGLAGVGGTYGGNGGSSTKKGSNGTDTTNIIGLDFTGQGLGGTSLRSGGGGYGGNGGEGVVSCSGGGGGYGGNGGDAHFNGNAGAGGGGYGGNGGDGGEMEYTAGGAGGGGGYGLNGNGGIGAKGDGVDGGNGGVAAGGGGGSCYTTTSHASHGKGGNGGNGVCIITYWKWE